VCNPIGRSFDPAPSATPDVPDFLGCDNGSQNKMSEYSVSLCSYTTRDASGSTRKDLEWTERDRIAANCVEREEGCPSRPTRPFT
jgi:hypothetical protein